MKIKFALRVGAWVVALGSASYTFAAPGATRLTDAKAAANDGLKIYSSVVAPDQARGVWAFGTTGYNPQSISINHDIMATAGGFEANGLYYINRYISMAGIEEMRTMSYYTSDWSEYDNFRTDYISYMATTIAYSYERDEAYGCFFDNTGEGYNFVRWNYEYYSPKAVIRNLERPWCACAFDGQGNLYALERNGDLYAVKTMNGEMTLIGHTGIESALSGDAAIDPATNTLYWAVANPAGNDVSSALYSVDLTSATATKLYDMAGNEQLCGMYIPREAATSPLLAPFRANSMTPRLTFSGNSLSGTFTFKSPYCNNDYDPLPTDEELTYTVKANGKVVATGTCLPNKQIDVPIELTESDNYYFTVTTANEYGTSLPTAAEKKFIGYDIPSAPTFNTPTVNGSTVSLSWRAPSTTGLNGGKIDASTCTYSVVRYPDMKQVATNITGTNVTDELPDPDVYTEYYYVLSTLAGTVAAPDVTSAKIGVGPVEPPHTWAFNSSAAVGEWTYEGKKPTYSSYYTALSLDASWESFDDWIFSPAVAVKNGGIYPVALTIFGGDNYMTEDVEVKWGTAPTAEAMTNTVVESTQYSGSDEKELTGELTSSVTGKIYIGVHISTTTSSYAEIYYKSVTIGEGVITGAPEAPAEFNAEATAPGAHNVAVSFNIPQYNVGGAPLADDNAITKVEILRDGTPFYTLSEGIVPGAKVEYTDMDVAVGTHTYAALAYNNYGEGEKASKELFVGVAKPLAPASVVMIEDGNTGSVTLTWDPVVTGVDDSTLPEGSVTYR
ncbi:MAG: hypothetical protein J1E29_08290, partial [Duncaniella sp.]|nr:hypothetical protein [Duncaniella sp.]